jgi:peptidoglycan/xylan/chitin deacetylase (PgdA/CDA1 family)
VQRLIALGHPVYCGGRRGRDIALTFDDGPGPNTRFALRLLRRNHARATFFIVGMELQRFPRMPRREATIAAIGDHTWTHPMLTKLSIPAVRSEVERTKQAAAQAAGVGVTLFRPPYADRSAATGAVVRKLGLLEVLWSVDSLDWQGATPPQILANVTAGLRPGSIVLMHENRGQTIKALRFLLPAIRRKHLRMVTVPELLATDPPSMAQLRRATGGCSSG